MFCKTTLKNGLRIVTVSQRSTQTVTVLVLVGTGSKYEKKEINGISHFLEHMFFKGTEKRPSVVAIAETLDKIGGIYNAFTSEDCTGYFAKVAASRFELALDWVSDIFLNSLLPEKEIEKEKGVVVEEINMRCDHPSAYVAVLWSKLLYGDQPAGWDAAGTKESVAKLSRQKLLDYMKKQYIASSTIICIAGNIENLKAVTKVKKYFSKIKINQSQEKPKVIDASVKTSAELSRMPSASTLSVNRRVEKQKEPECLLHQRKTDQTHFCLGVRSYNLFHPQRYAQELLGIILGGMMSSRLFLEIREKLGIAYYVSTSIDANPDTGYLVTQVGVDNNKVDKAIFAILKEYKKVAQRKILPKELKKAKDCTKGRMALLLEPSDAQASFYGMQELLEGKILTLEEIYDKIDEVTAADILKVAKDIFQPKKLNLTLIGPFEDKTKFQKLLKI